MRLCRRQQVRPAGERLDATRGRSGSAWIGTALCTGVLAALAVLSTRSVAQAASPEGEPWRAQWIADASSGPREPGVWHFRRDFDLAQTPPRLPVRISADNRYRLFVNGVEVSNGPARGDLLHWRYETVDIAPQLHAGHNVIAALVWNFGDVAPAAQISHRTAFLLQADGEAGDLVDTGVSAWKVLADHAYQFSPVVGDDSGGYYVAGPNEAVDAKLYPWGWERPDFDSAAWPSAAPVAKALRQGDHPNGLAVDWQLTPRTIPLPEQRSIRFSALRRATGIKADDRFLRGAGELVVPARSRVSLLIDNRELTLGYPVLVTSGGAGASATLTYAESLFDAAGHKGDRNVVEGKTIRGLRDRISFDGGADREFRSLWLRAFRYVQLDIETGAEPLRIRDMHAIFSAYPFVQHASFDSDAKWIGPIWNLDWRALRLSAFETFWDTPYYEQLQYVGDSRIESLLSVYQTGDARLMRNALQQFGDSRSAEGITRSSYPSWTPQFIPPFSLWWVSMIHDYWMLQSDPQFVRDLLPGTRGVLDWFEAHIDESGMLGRTPWWNFLDWTYDNGVPPGGATGGSAALTLQFVLALHDAAEFEQALGRPEQAEHYRALAVRLVEATRARCWDETRGLFADSPEKKVFSQQTNALALLAGAVPRDQRRPVMERILADRSLVQASYYFRFYVDEAMSETGMGDRYLERLGPWQDMLRNGLTATAETPEPTRSDSHAWSAHPNYHLLATVLGVRPAAPGFQKVLIAPALGPLRRASGVVAHPAGRVAVELQRSGPSGLAARIELPAGTPGEFRWGGQALALSPGVSRIRCAATCAVAP